MTIFRKARGKPALPHAASEPDLFDQLVKDAEQELSRQELEALRRAPLLEEEQYQEEKPSWRTRLNPAYQAQRFQDKWRTSLQFRILTSIIAVSLFIMLIFSIVMVNFVSQRLLNSKVDVANSEIDRVRIAVESQVTAQDSSVDLQSQLNSVRAAVLNQDAVVENQSRYDLALLIDSNSGITVAPEDFRVPEHLREFVSEGQIAYQYATVSRAQTGTYTALIIGTPTDSDIPGLQVYLLLPMTSEYETLSLLRGMMLVVGGIVSLLLVTIMWLLMQQILGPVRSASRIATRFSDGHLRERMEVRGEDEIAALAVSFNKMAESVSKQINELEQYGNLQRQFTSDVSHELRTPITAIRMAADMIYGYSDDLPAPLAKASEHLVRELDRFETLLADLLEISRFDAGVVDLQAEPFDIADPIRHAAEQVQGMAVKVGVPIFYDLPEQRVVLEGDARRVERIIRNLLANAIDHSERRPIVVQVAENVEAVAVAVIDHGVGLKPGQAELVFNRFWRADPSRQRTSGGTGLGLAISREDAALHGGTLDAIGEPWKGSMFRLVLPKIAGRPFSIAPIALAPPQELPPSELEDAATALVDTETFIGEDAENTSTANDSAAVSDTTAASDTAPLHAVATTADVAELAAEETEPQATEQQPSSGHHRAEPVAFDDYPDEAELAAAAEDEGFDDGCDEDYDEEFAAAIDRDADTGAFEQTPKKLEEE